MKGAVVPSRSVGKDPSFREGPSGGAGASFRFGGRKSALPSFHAQPAFWMALFTIFCCQNDSRFVTTQ